jgi:hypothetical protein
MLEHFSAYKMQVVINNHVDGYYRNDWRCDSLFEVKYFKYDKGI